jgi:hypothetical protein
VSGLVAAGAASIDGAAGGVASIVHSNARGTLALPAWSTATTANVWPPSPSVKRCGLAHGRAGAPSTAHRNDASASRSAKANSASWRLLSAAGALETVGAGGAVVSIVQRYTVVAPSRRAPREAVTLKRWSPSASRA